MNSISRLLRYILIGTILYFTIQCQSKKESSTIKENTCHCNDLVYDELYNYFFTEERTSPYNGKCLEYYDSGEVSLEKNFIDGKMHGNMIRFRKNGIRKSLVEFKLNFIDGKAIFYNLQGVDSVIQQYKKGKLVSNSHQ
jgi:antitoxin component YwqK of YwqJK toxin-antitoxin module